MKNLKTGCYRVRKGGWIEDYQVLKIMKKTAVVSTAYCMESSGDMPFDDGNYDHSQRYPIDLLLKQIKTAEFIPFKND